ncbi:MAG: hypothetical protein LBU73_08040 [Helicobacteraceae bacterium]|jgi:hypothetical protein|nr:hypothetical protein [Helicobacteraceae bacterium]
MPKITPEELEAIALASLDAKAISKESLTDAFAALPAAAKPKTAAPKPRKRQDEKRDRKFMIALTAAEFESLSRAAAKSGLNTSAFIRLSALKAAGFSE